MILKKVIESPQQKQEENALNSLRLRKNQMLKRFRYNIGPQSYFVPSIILPNHSTLAPALYGQLQLNRFVFVVTPSLPRNGDMAEEHEAPEAGQLPRAWTRGRRETESSQRVCGAKRL